MTLTIEGVDDPEVLTGLTGTVTEDDPEDTAQGQARLIDPDGPDPANVTFALQDSSDGKGVYGRFRIEPNGDWTYELDNASEAVNRLPEGQSPTENFPIEAKREGGPPSEFAATVAITVIGNDDEGVIQGNLKGVVVEMTPANETARGNITLPGVANAGFKLTDASQPSEEGETTDLIYGSSFRLCPPASQTQPPNCTNSGNDWQWQYTLNNTRPATRAIAAGDAETETVSITASNGATAVVTIEVVGAESMGVIEGDLRASLIRYGSQNRTPEDTAVRLGGFPNAVFMQKNSDQKGLYGEFKIETNGDWSYTLDNTSPAIKALAVGTSGEDRITITTTTGAGADADIVVTVIALDDLADPMVLGSVSGYLQGRAETLLDNQPGLTHFMHQLRSGSLSGLYDGQLDLQASEDFFRLQGGFLRGGLWGDLTFARSGLDDDLKSNDSDYLFGAFGLHRPVSETALAGLMVQFDQDEQGELDGRGWLVGPYLVAQHETQPVYFEGRLLYGETSNNLALSSGRTDTFDTQRLLAQFRVEGEILLDYGDIRLTPHLDASWVEDEISDDSGLRISGQAIRLGEVALGSGVEIPVQGRQNMTFTGGLSVISTRKDDVEALANPSTSLTRGRLELGLDYRVSQAIRLEFGGFYEEARDMDADPSAGLSFGLSSSF